MGGQNKDSETDKDCDSSSSSSSYSSSSSTSSSSKDNNLVIEINTHERNRECHKKNSKKGSKKHSKKRSKKHSKKGSKKCSKKGSKKHSKKGSKKCSKKCSKKGSKKKSSKKCSKKCSKKGSKNGSKKGSKKCSKKSEIECYSNESNKCKFKLCDIYNYFRNRLLLDEELMVAGSSSYCYSTSTIDQTIPTTHSVNFNNDVIMNNIERVSIESPFFIRESGVFIVFFILSVDSACQFSFYINGVLEPLTILGTNSGAGQLISRHMLKLKKNDSLTVRNYISTSNSVLSTLYNGGLLIGANLTMLIMKIAPYNHLQFDYNYNNHCLSHHKKKLFKKLSEKLECDDKLMVKGFSVHGTFFNTTTQIINTEANVMFATDTVVKGLIWSLANPDQIKVSEDGVYKLFFLVTTSTLCQFTICINGIPDDSTTQGLNKGSGQLTIRCLRSLMKDDVITVKNHTSASNSVTATEYAGGKYASMSAILTVFKIAPLTKPCIVPVDCNLSKHYECYYDLFRKYLLNNKCLQLNGSPSYFSLTSSVIQKLNANDTFNWSTNCLNSNSSLYVQGHNYITIDRDGIYDIFMDTITDQPVQYALFVNGVPNAKYIFGRDSGAARCIGRQFIKLNKNDVLTVRNYESTLTLTTSENPGGNAVGQSSLFMAFLLSPL